MRQASLLAVCGVLLVVVLAPAEPVRGQAASAIEPPATAGVFAGNPLVSEPSAPLLATGPTGPNLESVDQDAVAAHLYGLANYSCAAAANDDQCVLNLIISAVCPAACGMSGYDSCTDQDRDVEVLWRLASAARGMPIMTGMNCSRSRVALACTDPGFSALCPTTCGLCVGGVHTETAAFLGQDPTPFVLARDAIEQEVRNGRYACALKRRDSGFDCDVRNQPCPAL